MSVSDVDAVVVGAGAAGLYQLHRLRKAGLRTRVFEAGGGVGGTWYWNRYPGARCDLPSASYSYSFDPELEQEWTWSERYAPQPEIERYLNHVADRFDLRRDITLDTRVERAVFDELARVWRLSTDTGEQVSCQFLIMATGCLSAPKVPDIPGLDRFAGPVYVTGRWPTEGVDFTDRRVGVIGTGSSGVQSIPLIAEQAASLTVFQRTPSFCLPAHNRDLTDDEVRSLKRDYRQYRATQKSSTFGEPVAAPTRSAFEVSDETRRRHYEENWAEGHLFNLLAAYTDLLVDRPANATVADFIHNKIRATVIDPEVAEALCPTTYPFGTRRPCLDTNYYATYNLRHVRLVDLNKTPIRGITEHTVQTTEEPVELDALVLATGFDAITGALTRIDIRGVGGVELKDKWADGPLSYLGLTVAGFPNLLTINGPSSPGVSVSMFMAIEQHVEWITDLIVHMRDRDLWEFDTSREAELD
ncbi:MAG TPA: NAD(P)/FAD-dependent oxidoreductase, partial [Pseudonocardia sp.]